MIIFTPLKMRWRRVEEVNRSSVGYTSNRYIVQIQLADSLLKTNDKDRHSWVQWLWLCAACGFHFTFSAMPVNGRGSGADSEYTAFVGSLTLYYWSVDISSCCAAMERQMERLAGFWSYAHIVSSIRWLVGSLCTLWLTIQSDIRKRHPIDRRETVQLSNGHKISSRRSI